MAVLCSWHLNLVHLQMSQALRSQATEMPASPPSSSSSHRSTAGAASLYTHTLWPSASSLSPPTASANAGMDAPVCNAAVPPLSAASSTASYLPYMSTYLSAFLVSPPPPFLFHLLLQSTGHLLLRGGGAAHAEAEGSTAVQGESQGGRRDVQQAQQFQEEGDVANAARLLGKVLQTDPGNLEATTRMAMLQVRCRPCERPGGSGWQRQGSRRGSHTS